MSEPVVRRVALLVFDDADLLDVGGTAGVFQSAAGQLIRCGLASRTAYDVALLSRDGGPIRTDLGVGLDTLPMRSVDPAQIDTLLVTGGGAREASRDAEIVAWVRDARPNVRRLGSTCTGAFVLAAAGLLDGRRAATHWAYCDELAALHPRISVDSDSIFVEGDGLWTSAGSTSGMDMALAMVEQDYGRELALQVARRLVIFLKRPGGQSQFSAPLRTQASEGPLAPLLRWIVENPDADLRTEMLAERAHMSLRSFHRAFLAATGTPPAEWVELARMEVAKRLLEQTAIQVDQVALKAGFSSYERMRRAFARRTGITPAAYRARFARTALRSEPAIDAALLSRTAAAERQVTRH